MKLVIQIPCYNEEEHLPVTINSIPKIIPPFTSVDIIIIDDGSVDNTVEIAQKLGVAKIVSLGTNRGLAFAFTRGLEESIKLGADVIVNLDADNQYCADDIAVLVKPIIEGKAEYVIGSRPIQDIKEFSNIKKFLQNLGSKVVQRFANIKVKDATSGFRAISVRAACRVHLFGSFTYTLETLIALGRAGIRIVDVPIRVNSKTRESRLFKSNAEYIYKSLKTIIRVYYVYEPLKFFSYISLASFVSSWIFIVKYFYYFFQTPRRIHIQSMMEAIGLLSFSVILLMAAVITDTISANRKLLEELLYKEKLKLRRGKSDEAE